MSLVHRITLPQKVRQNVCRNVYTRAELRNGLRTTESVPACFVDHRDAPIKLYKKPSLAQGEYSGVVPTAPHVTWSVDQRYRMTDGNSEGFSGLLGLRASRRELLDAFGPAAAYQQVDNSERVEWCVHFSDGAKALIHHWQDMRLPVEERDTWTVAESGVFSLATQRVVRILETVRKM